MTLHTYELRVELCQERVLKRDVTLTYDSVERIVVSVTSEVLETHSQNFTFAILQHEDR